MSSSKSRVARVGASRLARPRGLSPLNAGYGRDAGTLLLALFLTAAQVCAAEDVRWINPAGGNFTDPGNWDAGRVPGSGDRAVIELEGTYTVNLDADVTIGGLTLGGQSGTQTLATEEERTLDLISQPVLIRENGVFRFRGTGRNVARFDNHGTVVLRSAVVGGEGIIYPTLDLVNHVDGLLRVEGYVQLMGRATNDGAMELTSAEPEGPMYLAAENLVNNGRIDVLRGEGGLRKIFSPVENSPSAVLLADTSLELAAPVVNHGTIELTAGDLECAALTTDGAVRLSPDGTLTLSGLTYDGGELGGPETSIMLVETGGTYVLNADLTILPTMVLTVGRTMRSGEGRAFNQGNILVQQGGNFKLTNQAGGMAELRAFSRLRDIVNEAGAVLRINAAFPQQTFRFNGAPMVNDGILELTCEVPATEVWLSADASLTNRGRIALLEGAGDTVFHFRADEIDNQPGGRIEIAANLDARDVDSLVNDGAIDVSGVELALDARAIDLANLKGSLTVTDGALHMNDGPVTLPAHPVALIRSTLVLTDVALTLRDDTAGPNVAYLLTRTTVNGPGRLINDRMLDASFSSFAAPLVNRAGAQMTFSWLTDLQGDVINETDGLIVVRNTIDIGGRFANEQGATVRVMGADYQDAKLILTQPFINDGVIHLLSGRPGESSVLRADAGLINNGTLRLASRGPAIVKVRDGAFVNHGDIRVLPSPGPNSDPPRRFEAALHNAADGVLSIQSNATIGLPGAGPLNDGRIVVNGCTLDTPVAEFLNRGEVEVTDGGALLAGGPFVQTAGATLLSNAILGGVEVRIEGGDLAGVGTVAPLLINAGRVAPGSPVGRLAVAGHYIQTPAGVLDVELAGRDPNEFDSLAVTGAAVLDGELSASLAGAFEPVPVDEFEVLTAAARTGRFAQVTAPCLAPRGLLDVTYDPSGVTVAVEPPLTGDLNCDCAADAFDIEPFVLALFDPAGYGAAYPGCDINLADLNGDGRVDASDIEPFIERLLE